MIGFARQLTLLLVGLAIAAGIGLQLGDRLARADAAQRSLAAAQVRGFDAAGQLLSLLGERRARAMLLVRAIQRNASKEAEARKAAYDEALVRWTAEEDGLRFRIRQSLDAVEPAASAQYVAALSDVLAPAASEAAPAHGLLARADACLSDAFDQYRTRGFDGPEPAKAALAACRFDAMSARLTACAASLGDSLYGVVGSLDDPALSERRAVSGAARIRETCDFAPPG